MLLIPSACEQNTPVQEEEKPEINLLSGQTVSLDPEGDDVMVSFYSAMTWSVEVSSVTDAQKWLKLSKTSGGKGDISINVVAEPNGSGKKRTASLDIISGDLTKSIVLSQESTDLDGKNMTSKVGFEGGQVEWEIKYSGDYEMDIDVDWISHVDTRALETDILVFEVKANDGEARTGKVTLSGSGKEYVLTVNQEAYVEEDVFRLLSREATASADGDRIEVVVETNMEYDYNLTVDWIKEVSTKAVEQKVHVFEVEPNPTDKERKAVLTFCANNECLPFTIIQEAGEPEVEDPYLQASHTIITFKADNVYPITVSVTSNSEWTVKSDKTWCKVSPESGSNDGSFDISCTENTGSERRAVVTVSSGDISCQIDVIQEAASADDTYIMVAGGDLIFSASSETKPLWVYSNETWTVSTDAEWCTVTPDSGNGDGEVAVYVSSNDSDTERHAVISFISGSGREVTIAVTQEGGMTPFLEVDTSGWTWFVNTAAESEVKVISNVAWQVTTNASWCTVSPSSGTGDGSFVVAAEENKTKKVREAVITVTSETIKRQFTVTQPGSSGTEGFEDDGELDWEY